MCDAKVSHEVICIVLLGSCFFVGKTIHFGAHQLIKCERQHTNGRSAPNRFLRPKDKTLRGTSLDDCCVCMCFCGGEGD